MRGEERWVAAGATGSETWGRESGARGLECRAGCLEPGVSLVVLFAWPNTKFKVEQVLACSYKSHLHQSDSGMEPWSSALREARALDPGASGPGFSLF